MALFSINRGVTPDMSYEQQRRQKLSNVFFMVALGACVVDVIDITLLGLETWVIILHIVIAFVPIVLLYINKFPKLKLVAIDGFAFIANIWIFLNASIYGPNSGIQYFYFPMLVGTFILVPPQRKLRLFGYLALSLACIITLEVTNYSLFLDTSISAAQIKQKYYIMFAVTVIEVILCSWYLVKVADKNEKMLQDEKRELKKLNTEMDRLNDVIEEQNIQLKSELHQKSLELLQQQKELNQALIEGEEKERKRLSRELHDGLGLLLSTAKIKMQTVDNPKLDENKALIDALELIDKACIELRLISQNLTPTMISEIGIEASLRSLIHSINHSKYLNIELITYGLADLKFNEQMHVQIYRMTLELINNCIKHSFANSIVVQLLHRDNNIHLQVEDDGSGMNDKGGVGHGLNNIRGTVEVYNGRMNIDSAQGKGTTVMISIPV